MPTFSEFSLIDHIQTSFENLVQPDYLTIGDDCAVLPYSDTQFMVITTDMLVGGVHFLQEGISPFELGAKSVAVNLSDLAAMGAQPLGVTLSMAIPSGVDDEYLREFVRGVRNANVMMLGGDTTSSKDAFTISITALGLVEKEHLKLRSGAKVGDKIYVTAPLGDSGAGLHALLRGESSELAKELIYAHHNPRAHLTEGVSLGSLPQVGAMMDISDGLASDLRHILRASNCSAIIDTERIPMSENLLNYCKEESLDPLRFALEGGEDYCLLFTASSPLDQLGFCVYEIGEIVENDPSKKSSQHTICWLPESSNDYRGFTHF